MKESEGKNYLITIVAPSGTGKTSLIQRLKSDFPILEESISFTTRPMRSSEKDGENYHFISREDFMEKMKKNDFLEWAEVHSHFYGTGKNEVAKSLSQGRAVLFDLDVQGCDSIKKIYPETKVIFIEPPSLDDLQKRLEGRGTDSPEVVKLRLKNARLELDRKNDFDYLVLNKNFEEAYRKLKEIMEEIIV